MTRLALLLAAVLLAGCQKPEEIRHYEVTLSGPRTPPKTAPTARPALPDGHPALPEGHPPIDSAGDGAKAGGSDAAAEKTMLAALVPVGEQGWTFKVTGPVEAMTKFADPFEKFVQGVTFSGGTPKWTLPDGWTEAAGGAQFRFATIKAKTDDPAGPPLEITVGQITLTPDYLLANVNRWRGQMSLGNLSAAELPKEIKTVTLPGKLTATLVTLTGKPKVGGMGRPPFAPGGSNGQ